MALEAYQPIIRKPQVQVVLAASLLHGLGLGVPLALVLLVEQETGSFAAAGAVTGAFAVAQGLTAPFRGRVVDRRGQSRVLPVLGIASASAMVALVVAAQGGAPLAILLVLSLLAGAFFPPVGMSVRALWASLVDDPSQLQGAYAIQAVWDEVAFILGPFAAGVLIALASPSVAVLVLTLVELAGVLAFAATPASRRWRGEQRAVGTIGALASAGMRTLVLVSLPVGASIGVLEVTVPAFTEARGSEAAAGIVLAALALGSLLGGLAYGSRAGKGAKAARDYPVLLLSLALLAAPLALADTVLALAILAGVAGVAIAPAVTTEYLLLDDVAPRGTATEALGWIVTASGVGLAAGAVGAGALVEGAATTAAFFGASILGLVGAALAWARRGSLRVRSAEGSGI
jgi:MFS family permease